MKSLGFVLRKFRNWFVCIDVRVRFSFEGGLVLVMVCLLVIGGSFVRNLFMRLFGKLGMLIMGLVYFLV